MEQQQKQPGRELTREESEAANGGYIAPDIDPPTPDDTLGPSTPPPGADWSGA